jgi:uncharacterized membrane protein YraQ (UPF0718 family)
MYTDISVTLPIAEALVGKGLRVGQMLAFNGLVHAVDHPA